MNTFSIRILLTTIAGLTLLFGISDAEETGSLAAQLKKLSDQFDASAPASRRAAFADDIAAVTRSGVVAKAISVGAKAPDFTLKNAVGEKVSLSSMLKTGPVVLTWYRGGWCPYCNATLRAYQEALGKITAAGGQLVALTPEVPDKSLSTREKNELKFEILSDLGQEVARSYGLVVSLTPEVVAIYKGLFDMKEYNGPATADDELPLAATYVIDSTGDVRWAFVNADYRKRAEPEDIITALSELETATKK